MISKPNEIKFIIIQVLLTLAIAFIPISFYLDASFENQKMKNKMLLKNYSSSVIFKIKAFEQENSDFFYYPRSNIFTSGIYGEDDKAIFSLLQDDTQINFNTQFLKQKQRICYKEYLPDNIFGAKYIVVCKDIDNSQVIYNAIILLLTITCLIFLSSFFTIKQSIEPYKQLNRYLDDFLKDAMHELKTPIGVARINLDMLRMRLKNNTHLLRITSALKNMTVVYEDLEYYIQSHLLKDEKKTINFSHLLEQRVEFFNDLVTAKNIQLITHIEDGILLQFNEIELYRVIDNNISNAIKYSKEGSFIKISLQKKDLILLRFEDNGIGIKDTSRIFNRYYRGDKVSGGFGIGLNIVKNICVKNSVAFNVTSRVGRGSTFTYTFKDNAVPQ